MYQSLQLYYESLYYKLQSLVTLPIPNIEVLSSAGAFSHRYQAVTHILETTLIGWIKQIKVISYFFIMYR